MITLIKITVPATSANMGPGFDCVGMSFKLYNTIYVDKCDRGLHISCHPSIPNDENNLIYQTMRGFYDEIGQCMPGLVLRQEDYIPLTRGLGSSAACIVSGLLAANELSNAGLSRDDLISMAARIEGHPDNSTPAFAGGIVIGVMTGNTLDYIKIIPPRLDELAFVVMIPNFELETKKARRVLPDTVSRGDAVYNASRAALLIAAFMSGDFEKLSSAFDDRLHQPYRMPLVPGMKDIFMKTKDMGAMGAFLSGAGPTLIAVVEQGSFADDFCGGMRQFVDKLEHRWSVDILEPDLDGAIVENISGGGLQC